LIVVERWVSQILQMAAFALLCDSSVRAKIKHAGRTYDQRREAMIESLAEVDLQAMGRSGFNIWLPVDEETSTVQALAAAGWAVAAGERFRLNCPPGIRITASRIGPAESQLFARALGRILSPVRRAPAA
ncbi:MAG: aminotransferase class I/II-fold pyridoxal phosphate-dependent enzyme, partial [Phycisphaerales bacterium]|nr:aminotransferase class I/II-fold pyridoxal phosphate-dependent enzyme [Phycisphaerales bacterium]